MEATIIAEKGNYLLVARGERFAVIERRNNRLCKRSVFIRCGFQHALSRISWALIPVRARSINLLHPR